MKCEGPIVGYGFLCCRENHLTVISLASDTSTAWFLVCFCGVYILHPTAQCTGTPTHRHLSKHCPEVPAHRHSELGKQPQKVPAHSTQAHIVPSHCVPVHRHITPSSYPKTHHRTIRPICGPVIPVSWAIRY